MKIEHVKDISPIPNSLAVHFNLLSYTYLKFSLHKYYIYVDIYYENCKKNVVNMSSTTL